MAKTYILDLSRVTGLARKAILLVVLTGLKSLGYKWTFNPLAPLDVTRLILSANGNPNEITFDNSPLLSTFGHTVVFDFNQVEDFLLQAQAMVFGDCPCLGSSALTIVLGDDLKLLM